MLHVQIQEQDLFVARDKASKNNSGKLDLVSERNSEGL